MPPIVIDVARAEDVRDVVHRAVQALVEGQIVALPTETVYGLAASACCPEAVARLAAIKGGRAGAPFALAIKSAEEAEDYSPGWGLLARRLARRCWPGPVTLVVDGDHPAGLVNQLPDAVKQHVCPAGTVGLRVPANPVVQDVLRMLAGPIALTSANKSGKTDAVTAEEVVKAVGDDVDLVLDAGPAHYGQPSTVVHIHDKQLKVLREGVVGEPTLERLSKYLIVMVCTGNTCRSPMAEVLMRQQVAQAMGCTPDELEDRGVLVCSAGLAAAQGAPASKETEVLMKEQGFDLSEHSAQQLSDQLVQHADLIVTMTRSHRQAIVDHWPEAASRTKTLVTAGGDVADPIGGPIEVYRQCAEQIQHGIEDHIQQIVADVK